MPVIQKEISLNPKRRGFTIITNEVLSSIPEIKNISAGMLHIFIKHTSASLSINENADPDVRKDLETYFNITVPENASYYIHRCEGPDDMPAHIKASVLGSSLTIPITNGSLNLGTWQRIYLCEHRNSGGRRNLVLTVYH
jgi:secondary thiamine-phosphate synthase enzyme